MHQLIYRLKVLRCKLLHRTTKVHLDYIWGSLPREHTLCGVCGLGLSFERPSEERERELQAAGDIRDGDTRGCNPI